MILIPTDAPPVTPAQQAKADEVMSAGRWLARKTAPYFRSILLKLVPRAVPGLRTVGVTDTAILMYDPLEIGKWTAKQMAGVLIHEVMHLWLEHGPRLGKRDPTGWNQAGDRAINPGILEIGLELPLPGGQPACWPKDLGMKDGLTADEYYLADQQKQKKAPGAPGFGCGQCGSCAGNPLPGEPEADDPEGRSSLEMERTARQTTEAVNQAARDKSQGRVPSSWARFADIALEPPQISWQAKLSAMLRRCVAFRPGAAVHRYDAPSRRQAGIGYGMGCPVLPRTRQPVPEVAVVFDTSGSMGGNELGEAARETDGILKSVGAKVTFCVCDAEVHGLAEVRTVQEALKMLKGGGGTDFRPAFEALAKRRPLAEVIVFFTDGFGQAPDYAPAGVRVIWVLVGQYHQPPATWGEVLHASGKTVQEAS